MNHLFKVDRLAGVAATVLIGAISACSSGNDSATSNDAGFVALALEVGPVLIDTVDYTITGPASYSKTGSIDVSGSAALSARLSGIPQGAGYSIALTAIARGGGTTCAGSAPFDVTAAQTTQVDVRLNCTEGARTGSILVNGSLNICPTVRGVDGAAKDLIVGSTIQLAPIAHDIDGAPSPLAYQWTATNGTLSDPAAEKPLFTCAGEGPAAVTVNVSDGDISPGCAGTAQATINCFIPVPDGGLGGGTGSGGVSGTGGVASTGGLLGTGGDAGISGAPAGGVPDAGVDGSPGNPVDAATTLLATASPNTAFRGVALAPNP